MRTDGIRSGMLSRAGRIGLLGGLLLAIMAAALPARGAPAGTPEDSPILGPWLSEQEEVIVEFYPCGDEVCGRIAWLAKPYKKSGEIKRDDENPDPALRDRLWCGIQVIDGLESDGDGSWEDGQVYDPKSGNTYSLEAKVKGADRLKLRAYVGLTIFGRTETWARPAPDHEITCDTEGRASR